MFSGIVEEVGQLRSIEQIEAGVWRLQICANQVLEAVTIGDSIAVNGTCLTVIEFDHQCFVVEVVAETLRCTNLGALEVGSAVNLERSITMQTRIGGHFVQGHVDCSVEVLAIENDAGAKLLTISLPEKFNAFVIDKGYVAIDGMSLTVIKVSEDYFTLTLIPHTQAATIAEHYQVGTRLNLEVDMLAKYAVKAARATQ